MAYKVLVLASLVGVACGGIIGGHGVLTAGPSLAVVARGPAPVVKAVAGTDTDFDPSPQYSYAYDIADSLTGDNKGQQETRDGDVVQGSYTLLEADGSRRTVEYTADPVNGFNAVVHREAAVVGGKAVVGPPAGVQKPVGPFGVAKVPAAVGFAPLHTQLLVLAGALSVASAGLLGAPAVVAPGAPLAAHAYAAPAYAAPAYAAPAYAAPAVAVTRAAPVVAKAAVVDDYDPNPQYSYAYDIQDALTGDSKGQQETRNGDVVQGSYSLVEPDGSRRTVEYTADPVNGFNAVVHREPVVAAKAVVAAPAVAKVAAPVAYAAPAYAKVAAPVAYAAPAYAAPAAYAAPLHTKAILG
ncbi:cuticle protein-like [Schistocerca gregaria]|uniref:cuticle protein-like n=1 Tax=Schistocerca gregaria TaxID=7010 RepID=UPI00211E3461|nr:cuticle protein-like [Schistocerca gregaria]